MSEQAPGRPASPPQRSVESLEDLAPLGALAETAWRERSKDWALTLEPGGYVGLQNLAARDGRISIRYFELWRNQDGLSLSARVTVEVERAPGFVACGLVYGRTDQREYFLIGVDQQRRSFIKQRTPRRMEDRLSRKVSAGPHSFGIVEEGRELQVKIDGRVVLGLGDAAAPQARVGVFVLGGGLVRARDFEFELR